MNNKILFLFLTVFFISSNQSASQTFEGKVGVGIYNVYENDILTGRGRNVKFYPSPFVSFLLDWKLSSNIFLGWENRIRIKSGEISHLGLDTIENKIAVRFKSKMIFYNFDVKAKLSYLHTLNQDFQIEPFICFGFSLELLDDSPRANIDYSRINHIIPFPADDKMPPENNNILKRSGFIGGAGIKILINELVMGLSSDVEFFRTFLYNVGEPSYIFTSFFIGYRF
jgi:hypothetical protein